MRKNIISTVAYTMASLISGMGDLGVMFSERQSLPGSKSVGIQSKKCKSCRDFDRCRNFKNKSPMDNACNNYIKKKRR